MTANFLKAMDNQFVNSYFPLFSAVCICNGHPSQQVIQVNFTGNYVMGVSSALREHSKRVPC